MVISKSCTESENEGILTEVRKKEIEYNNKKKKIRFYPTTGFKYI
jgi:hypothetical protein